MDIDKLIPESDDRNDEGGFSSLMDIDKLIPIYSGAVPFACFSSLMDIDKLILADRLVTMSAVLVL